MTAPLAPVRSAADAHAALRASCQQMEALFYGQLLAAMRAATPEGGAVPRSEGEKMFTTMLDDHLAEMASAASTEGLGEAMYRQLARRLPTDPAGAATAAEGAGDGGTR